MNSGAARPQTAPPSAPVRSTEREAIGRFADLYCVACHNSDDKTAGLALDAMSAEDVSQTRRPGSESSRSSSLARCRRRTKCDRPSAHTTRSSPFLKARSIVRPL